MRKLNNRSFKELLKENRQEILNDQEALARIDDRLERRAQSKLV